MRRLTLRATYGLWLVAVLTLAGCPLLGAFSGPSPQLRIIPAAFEFTDVLTNDSFTITNGGAGVLSWEIESAPDWLVFNSATSGTLTPTQSFRVLLETDTEGLDDGVFNGFIVVASNGGRIQIPVVIGVGFVTLQPSIRVAPASLDFGRTGTERTLTVSNGGIQGNFTFTATGDEPWIDDITPSTGNVGTNSIEVTVVVSRAGLADGDYTGNITFSAPDLDDVVIPVTMEVSSDVPELSVTPTELDFGTNVNTRTVTVRNPGSGTLFWEVDESLPWLEVTPLLGTTTTESDVLTVTVDRGGQPAGPLDGSFIVRSSEGDEVEVTVSALVLDAVLVVTPTTLNYGNNQTSKLLSITNGGIGSVTWAINAASLPPWLSVNNTGGTVTTGADSVLVTVDRTGLPPELFSTTFEVTSNAGSATVTVTMSVLQPELTITSGLNDSQGNPATTQAGVPIVDLGTNLNTATFTVANTGTGVLNWEINPNQILPWFTLNPVQGSLTAGQSETVTVAVTRDGPFGGASATLLVSSNAGNRSVVIARTVAKIATLGVDPAQISLGTTESTASFFAANFGDVGTNVEYEIISDREWLFVSPDTGSSEGTATPPPFKDFREHNIFIDRSRLAGGSAVGTLTLRATSVDTAQDPADVPTATVQVSVEAAPLSFEHALFRGRRPSLLRYTFTMRDIFFETITTPADIITADAFSIVEDGIPIDLTESNVFLTDDYDVNLVIALDYSGSMQVAASRVFNTANPLQDLYEATLPDFINQLPERYKVSLLAFFDRDQASRVQIGFSRDRAATIAALEQLRNSIGQFGATELIPALGDAALLLENEAGFNVPFDDPDVRAVVAITDGRGTTPPGEVTEFVDGVSSTHVRFFNIVWGVNQNFAVPGVVATETGGHLYVTVNSTDGDDNEIPSQQALSDRLDEIVFDLDNQYLLTYVTLNEATTAAVRVTAAFDPPEDDGTPQNQGVIQGSFEQDAAPANLIGDTRMGQISMRSDGIRPDGSAEVIIRSDYIPRDIDTFEFTISATEGFFVERVEPELGGIVSDWSLTQVGNTFTLDSPGDVLPYGTFGPLLRLVFAPFVAPALEVNLAVSNAPYAALPNNSRYFIAPSIIRVVTGQDALAQAFPTPEIDIDPSTPDLIEQPLVIDIPSSSDSIQILVRNTGGVFLPTGVLLNWEIASTPSFVGSATGPNGQPFGVLTATRDSALITVDLNRDGPAGFFSEPMFLVYDTGTLGYTGAAQITLRTTVQVPELAVETSGPGNSIDFGDTFDTATMLVRNAGQSTLAWTIDPTGLPDWIGLSSLSGQIGADGANEVTVTVDRTGLAPGNFSTSFPVSGFGDTEVVTVEMVVP